MKLEYNETERTWEERNCMWNKKIYRELLWQKMGWGEGANHTKSHDIMIFSMFLSRPPNRPWPNTVCWCLSRLREHSMGSPGSANKRDFKKCNKKFRLACFPNCFPNCFPMLSYVFLLLLSRSKFCVANAAPDQLGGRNLQKKDGLGLGGSQIKMKQTHANWGMDQQAKSAAGPQHRGESSTQSWATFRSSCLAFLAVEVLLQRSLGAWAAP